MRGIASGLKLELNRISVCRFFPMEKVWFEMLIFVTHFYG